MTNLTQDKRDELNAVILSMRALALTSEDGAFADDLFSAVDDSERCAELESQIVSMGIGSKTPPLVAALQRIAELEAGVSGVLATAMQIRGCVNYLDHSLGGEMSSGKLRDLFKGLILALEKLDGKP